MWVEASVKKIIYMIAQSANTLIWNSVIEYEGQVSGF